MESKRVKEEYGQDFGIYYHIRCFFDNLLLGYFRLKGVKDILELTSKQDFAFEAKIPNKFTLIKAQIPLRDGLKLFTP